jgi:hypothetical protein
MNRAMTAAFLLSLSFTTTSAPAESVPVVIPFDLESRFDDGRYGQKVARLIHARLRERGGAVLPDAMLSVRDTCRRADFHPGPETPPTDVGRVVRERFGGQVGIWGGIERAEGRQRDVYDLTLRAADFSTPGRPRVLARLDVRTRSVSEIPHRHVPAFLDKLYASGLLAARESASDHEPTPDDPPSPPQSATVVFASDFEHGTDDVPHGWARVGGPENQPLGEVVRWLAEEGNPTNRVLRLELDRATGNSTGAMYYSRPFPIESGQEYRLQFRCRSGGPQPIVFVKGYATVPGAREITQTGTPPPDETRENLREVYRRQQRPAARDRSWHTHTAEFTPRHSRFEPFTARVMLYAYHGAGWVEFDDVRVVKSEE